ncbi:MAG: AAA domain-containing protein [Cyclobacteriaceae bacterium]
MQQILQSYLRRLTNLSSNNRSLLLLKLTSEQFIDVHDFDFAVNEPSFSIIDSLIAQKSRIPLCPILDSRDGESNVLSRRLKRLQRVEKFIFDERGGKDLYVGWPLVRGKFSDGTVVRCPLMFFPVDLFENSANWVLEPRKDVNLTLNKSFLLAYAYFNGIKVNEDLLERVFDDFDKDSRVFRTSLYELFKESEIELQFNQENFVDKLSRFEDFKKSDLENLTKTGELKLYPEAVLGIFPQAGSYLVPDYVKLIEENPVDSLEDFFISRTIEKDKAEVDLSKHSDSFRFLNRIKEEQTITPFETDAYQENAIKAVKSGNSIVVQGPPGTGKSQMICNLICDYISRGMNVLLVCQKRAALDVVYGRLKEKDITDFVGLVHDFKNDRKGIFQQIASQVERVDEYKQKNSTLDAIQLERQFLQESRKIDQLTEQLDEYKNLLFDEGECGKSAKELYLTSDPEDQSINIKQEYRHFLFDKNVDEFVGKLRLLAAYASKFEDENYPWRQRKSFAKLGVIDLKSIRELLDEIPTTESKISEAIQQLCGTSINLEEAAAIYNGKEKIDEMLTLLKDKGVYDYFKHICNYPDKETDVLWLSNVERTLMDCYKGVGPELSQDLAELGRLQEALERSRKSRRSLFKWLRWKLFSKDKLLISRVLVANGLKSKTKSFQLLVEKVDNRLNLEHNLTKLRDKAWLTDLPKSLLKIDLQNWFFYQKKALKAKMIFTSLRNFLQYVNPQNQSLEEFETQLRKLIQITKEASEKNDRWLKYLNQAQIQQFATNADALTSAKTLIDKDFDSLVDYDQIKTSLQQHENVVFDKLMDEAIAPNDQSLETVFQNSLRLAWLDHIETKYPVLRSVSSLKFDKMESELQEAVLQKQKISNQILLLKAREKTYNNLEYNRLNNLVTYRDLNHQVTKKRRIWPVRKVIANFHEEAFNLVPCWMVSPEAASAIFPMSQVFDLVIFDEASQCFAERGLPAMYRGRQVVVTGDDKQLKPNDLYRVRWEDENDDDLPELDVDSLLNLANQHLMQVQLRGHYRSKKMDLIQFSNEHFYNLKLRLLPDFNDINSGEPAIEYRKVEGRWENNSNYLEAQEVVHLIWSILDNHPDKEIGVVTFNVAQQTLILDLLEEDAADKSKTIPETLFIKNIENVQGDEKDVIIFSIGYAPDKSGRMMMQFGSLNVDGGENRLNVAVTRSREKVYVVASVHPTQLKTDDTKNEGPKLLKKYLEYALKVSEGKTPPPAIPDRKYPYSWYLKKHLMQWEIPELSAFILNEELPFTDLTVKKFTEYRGLIITDDDVYHESISAKQAHAYWPFIMRRKNWVFAKFHSREFWLNKASTREKLVRFLNTGVGVEAMKK